VFCSSCGKKADETDKFCTNCGEKIKEVTVQVTEELGNLIKEEYKENHSDLSQSESEVEETISTTKMLGNKLEETVERIFNEQGYETKIRQKILGQSNTYNEIDVLATRKNVRIAIECKNYSEDRKVGIKEIRDFVQKLDDLDIHRGTFVTSSYFSEEARNFAENNTSQKRIELWDKEDLSHELMATAIGRNPGNVLARKIKIENTLPVQDTIEDYCILHLKNQDKVSIRRRDLTFVPVYIVSFNLHEEFKAPDKRMYAHHNEGHYYLDGTTGRFLFKIDSNEKKAYSLSDEEKQMISDLLEIEPRMIEIEEINNSKIIQLKPSIDRKNIEFQVRNEVANDNKKIIEYQVKVSREEYVKKHYPHMPHHSSIQCQTRFVYVPRLEIEFESKEYVYEKIVMMASGVVIRDEISECKHLIGKKTTFAVCDVCGAAKCEKDILLGNNDNCFCKKHAPKELKDAAKENSTLGKLSKFLKR